jgi:CheY-like chemotaxis protein
MPPDNSDQPPQATPSALKGDDFARRVAKARHDLRNPVAHILGFSEMLGEKAREHGYNYIKGRLELIDRAAAEMIEAINGCLDPKKIQAGESDVAALGEKLRRLATRIASVTDALSRKPLVRKDEVFSSDLARIAGAARQVQELSGTALAVLLGGAPDSTSAVSSQAAPASPPPSRPIAGTVLVVDDELEYRNALGAWLTQQGYAVQLAASGREALAALRRVPADMVLLDLAMPEMDGAETLKAIRADAVLRQMSVVVLGSAGEAEGLAQCLRLGADDFLQKPIHPALLAARVESCLARKRLREQVQDFEQRLRAGRQ